MMEPNKKLIKGRIDKGLTQLQLATATGVSQATINKLESGKIEQPSFELAVKIANVLKVNVFYLFLDELPNNMKEIESFGFSYDDFLSLLELCRTYQIQASENIKLFERLSSTIKTLAEAQETNKDSIIQLILGKSSLKIELINENISNAKTDSERHVLKTLKEEEIKRRNRLITGQIELGVLSQEDIDNYYSLLRKEYEEFVKN